MRGHLTKRSKNSWSIVLYLGRDPVTGKRRQKWVSVKGPKRNAEAKLGELLALAQTGGLPDSGRQTVAEYLRYWLDAHAAYSVRSNSLATYRRVIERDLIPALGFIRLDRLRASHIQAHYRFELSERGLSGSTVSLHHTVLNSALGRAVKSGLLAANPAKAADAPRVTKPDARALDHNQAKRLLGAATGTQDYVPVYLTMMTGLRRSELLGLQWSAVDLEHSTLSVVRAAQRIRGQGVVLYEPKTPHSRRRIDFGPGVSKMLRRHRAGQMERALAEGAPWTGGWHVVANREGGAFSPDRLSGNFTRLAASVGIRDVTFRNLRHTHATLLLADGVHPKIVQERLGHAKIATTLDTYSHVLPGLQREAALKLERTLSEMED